MGFKVYGYKSEPFDEFGDGDRYKVIEGGALEIWHEDGSKLTVSPTRWGWVEEDVPDPEDTDRASMSRSDLLPEGMEPWTLAVLQVVHQLGKRDFTLSDVYAHRAELEVLYPNNAHIDDKIRQQLQRLREFGIIDFRGGGFYSLREDGF